MTDDELPAELTRPCRIPDEARRKIWEALMMPEAELEKLLDAELELEQLQDAAGRDELAQYRREAEAEQAADLEAAKVQTSIVQCSNCRAWIPKTPPTCPRCGYDPIPL